MFTSTHQASIRLNYASAQTWANAYFSDAVAAIDLAMSNPEYLGWLKILLGPKYDSERLNNFYQIFEQESELHLNLVVFNVIKQMLYVHREKQVFKSIRQKIKDSGTLNKKLPIVAEVADVEQFYTTVRQYNIVGHENKLWFTIVTTNGTAKIVESNVHRTFYKSIFNCQDISRTNDDNVGYSYELLFNKYARLVGAKDDQPVKFPLKKFINKIKKYFEYEQEKLQTEYYNSWKERVSPQNYSKYNVKVSKRFAAKIQKQMAVILSELENLNDIELVNLASTFAKKVISLQKNLDARLKVKEAIIDKYKYHVRTWMTGNKALTPEKYRNVLPEYLAQLIIKTNIHLVPQENFSEPATGDTLLHKASKYLSSTQNIVSNNNCFKIISLLLKQGSNAFIKNKAGAEALSLSGDHFSQQLSWRLVKEQLKVTAYIDPLLNLIASELAAYAERNDSVITAATHNAETKKTRLHDLLNIMQVMHKARFTPGDEELIETLLLCQEQLIDKSSALASSIKKIITKIQCSEFSGLIKKNIKPEKSKKKIVSKQPELHIDSMRLYQQYYELYRDNVNPAEIKAKYNHLFMVCISLVDAAITGNVDAQSRLVSTSQAILSFDALEMFEKEYYTRLEQLLSVHDNKSEIYQRLALMGLGKLTTKFYNSYHNRYQDVFQTLKNKHLVKSEEFNQESAKFYEEKAFRIILDELVGRNPLNASHTDFKYSHRLISRDAYKKLATSATRKFNEDDNFLEKYLQEYDLFVANNIRVVSCQQSANGKYQLDINAVDIDAAARPLILFVDAKTGNEVARFNKSAHTTEFRAHGSNIKMKVAGNLEGENYIFRNSGTASIALDADFSAKNLQLGVDAAEFIYAGKASVSHGFSLEASNKVKLNNKTQITATHALIKSESLTMSGKLNAAEATLQVAQDVRLSTEALITTDGDIHLFANSITEMRGNITAGGDIKANIEDSVYVHGAGSCTANNFELRAASLMVTDRAKLHATKGFACRLKKSAIFNKQATITASNFFIHAPVIKNYSPNLCFDAAEFYNTDVMTNHPTGIIKTKYFLKLRGESVWSSGRIEYGKGLQVTLNKVFILGLAERKDIFEYFKNIRKKPARPCISGGNAVIVSGLFLNLFSGVWTKNLSITALADIDLFGLTCATNTVKSRILAIDAGVSIPNVAAISEGFIEFFDAIGKGEYINAFRGLLSYNALFRASSFTRLLIRSLFPMLGKPVDFIWGGGSLVCALPGLCSQVKGLYDLGADIELHQFTSLLSSVNSAATQAMIVESQTGILREGIGAIEYQAPASLSALGLDIAALALPSINDTAFISFNSGIEAEFSIQQRDFITCSRLNAWLAINTSQTFYDMYDQDHEVMANNYSLIGNEAYLSGGFYGTNFFADINDFYSAATLNVDRALLQVGHLELLRDSKTNANILQATTTNTEIQGVVKAKHAVITATDTVINKGTIEAIHDPDARVAKTDTDAPPKTDTPAADSDKDAVPPATDPKDAPPPADAPPAGDKETPPPEPAPSLVIKAHYVVNVGEITGQAETIALLSDDKIEQKGQIDVDTLIEEAKEVDNDGIAYIHKMLVDAEKHAELTGAIHIRATDKPGEVDFITPDLASSPDSEVSGDGRMYVDSTTSTLGKVDVNELIYKADDIQDEEDFIMGQGRWANVHARSGLSLTSHNNLLLDRGINLSIDLSVTANAIKVVNNLHSSKNLNLVSTGSGIDVTRASVTADGILAFTSNTYFNNDHGYEYGDELYIQAKIDVLNQAGGWAAKKYMLVKSEAGNIILRCDETDVQGRYDTMKSYKPAYVYGGNGEGHDGVGLVMVSGKRIIIDGSIVNTPGSNLFYGDEGIDILARHHTYESYYRHSRTFWGKTSTTVEYDNQVQPSTIISQNGSNTLSSKSGYIYSCAGQFLSGHDNNFYAKSDITLLGMVLEKKCYKNTSAFWGLYDHKTIQKDDQNTPTFVINPENTRMISLEQSVNIFNALIISGNLDIFGYNVTLTAPLLNHYYREDTRSLGINSPIFSLPNNLSALYNDFTTLTNSLNGIEFGVNSWNMGVDAMNSLNNVISGLRNGSLSQSLLSTSNLASVQLTYSHTRTAATYQTMADNVGIFVGNENIEAVNTLTLAGEPNSVANNAMIHAKHFIETGLVAHSSVDISSQSISAGVSLQGVANAGASLSESGSNSTYYINQKFHVGGTLTVDVEEWDLSDANVDAGKLEGKAGTLSAISHLNKTTSFARAISANTNCDFAVQNSNNKSGVIGTPTSMTTGSTNLAVSILHLEGAKVISSGQNSIKADIVEGKSVDEYSRGRSIGFSGNINNLSNPQPGVDGNPSIPLFNVGVGYQNYEATQQVTINGSDLQAKTISGDRLNTSSTDGLQVRQNDHLNLQMRIPVLSQAAVAQLEDNLSWAANKLAPSESLAIIDEEDDLMDSIDESDDQDKETKTPHQPAKPAHPSRATKPAVSSKTVNETEISEDKDQFDGISLDFNDPSTMAKASRELTDIANDDTNIPDNGPHEYLTDSDRADQYFDNSTRETESESESESLGMSTSRTFLALRVASTEEKSDKKETSYVDSMESYISKSHLMSHPLGSIEKLARFGHVLGKLGSAADVVISADKVYDGVIERNLEKVAVGTFGISTAYIAIRFYPPVGFSVAACSALYGVGKYLFSDDFKDVLVKNQEIKDQNEELTGRKNFSFGM